MSLTLLIEDLRVEANGWLYNPFLMVENIQKSNRKLIKAFKYFDLWQEDWVMAGATIGGDKPTTMRVYYSKNGIYLGGQHNGKRPGIVKAIDRLQMTAERASTKHSVASIGKSAKDGKWYGWSHRAMVGFGLGDKVYQDGFGGDSTPFVKHGKTTIKTDAQAREAAVAFARSVS
jgi:hypothetical protein